jgi:DNA-binding transcriptional LysR family regulator
MTKINIYPNPWDLIYFQEVAQTLNLSRASERLGIGQSALSLSLKRLERCLQVDLFLRRSRGLVITPSGQRLLRESKQLLATWEALVSETKKSETEIKGKFTVGCHASVAIYALKENLAELYKNFPTLEIQLIHGLSRLIAEGVISGQIDFGVVVNPIRHPDLVIKKLATDEVCLWKSSRALEDVLICNPQMIQTQELVKKLKKKGSFTRMITSDNLEVIATLASSGAGVAILPTRVKNAVAPGLKRVGAMPSYLDEVTFLYRADLPKTPSSRCIVESFSSIKI